LSSRWSAIGSERSSCELRKVRPPKQHKTPRGGLVEQKRYPLGMKRASSGASPLWR